jgi:hypothetical protein
MPTELRLSAITTLCFAVNAAIDHGVGSDITPDEIKYQLKNETLFPFLEKRLAKANYLGWVGEDQLPCLQRVLNEMRSLFDDREYRKLAIENAGLCLLMAYCLEAIAEFRWDITKIKT